MATITRAITNHQILAGMVMQGAHSSVLVENDAESSSVFIGCSRIETDLGALYLDSEGSSTVEYDPRDYPGVPGYTR